MCAGHGHCQLGRVISFGNTDVDGADGDDEDDEVGDYVTVDDTHAAVVDVAHAQFLAAGNRSPAIAHQWLW